MNLRTPTSSLKSLLHPVNFNPTPFSHSSNLLDLLPPQAQPNPMVIRQAPTNRSTKQQHRQQHRRNRHVEPTGHVPNILDHPPLIPAVDPHHEDQIVDQRVHDRCLDLRHHGAGLLALSVFGPGATVLLDHPYQLHVAGHDCRNRHDEAGAQHEVPEARNVEEGVGVREAGGEEGGFEDLGCQAV